MEKPQSLWLYVKSTCPFCLKVLHYLEDLGKSVPLKETKAHPEYQEELIKLSGKKQVPCLVIDGEPMFESDAIILWIEEHQDFLKDSKNVKL